MGKNKNNNNNARPNPMLNAKTMGREGMRAIKDLAFGNYNFYKEGHVFRNPEFVKATIAEVDRKLLDTDITLRALNYAYAASTDPAVMNLIYRTDRTYKAYSFIRNQLVCTLNTGDTGFLLILPKNLGAFKYNI